MVDGGVQGTLRSVKLLWDTQPKAIQGTTPRADPNSSCGLSGGTDGSVVNSASIPLLQGADSR